MSTLVAPRTAFDGHESPGTRGVWIRPAEPDEADALHELISDQAAIGHLLPRTRRELAQHVSRFFVAAASAAIVGCAELLPLGPRLAEVRSLTVRSEYRGRGVGTRLIARVVHTASAQGYVRICAFTRDPRAFVPQGFSIVLPLWIPEKIAADCRGCHWFRRCTKCALVLNLASQRTAQQEGHGA